MNKLQEISAGLVLLFGGDGPAAQRAGDALLADRIEEAVEEGGFSAIDYGSWRKSAASASRLEFESVSLTRGPGTVAVENAGMEVFSRALEFDVGSFRWTEDAQHWRFDRVEIEPGGFFSRSLRISALGLDPEPRRSRMACADPGDAACALRQIGSAPVERFHMVFRGRSRDAVVTIAWESGEACWLAWTLAGRGSADLASWGRNYLEAPRTVSFRAGPMDCDLPDGEAVAQALEERVDEVDETDSLSGEEVFGAAPVLVQTLFGLVAESYAYLLE